MARRQRLGHAAQSLSSRAAHWATSPGRPLADEDRAARDGRVLAGLLSPEQLTRYTETQDRRAAAACLARERLAVLTARESLEPTGEEREALTVPWEAPGTSSWLIDTFRGMTLVAGLGIVVSLALTPFIQEAGAGIALLLGLLVAITVTAERFVSAAQDRTRVAPLLDWATTRPGQLGRGVPGSGPRSTLSGSLRPLFVAVWYVLTLSVLIGGFFLVVVGLLSLLIWAVNGSVAGAFEASYVLSLAAAVVVPIVVGGLLLLLWRAGTLAEWRRASALEWLVPQAGSPEVDEAGAAAEDERPV